MEIGVVVTWKGNWDSNTLHSHTISSYHHHVTVTSKLTNLVKKSSVLIERHDEVLLVFPTLPSSSTDLWNADFTLFSVKHKQGEDDEFLHGQLLPHKFEEACRAVNAPLLLRLQPGYNHSYFFIATFMEDHIRHHSQALRLP